MTTSPAPQLLLREVLRASHIEFHGAVVDLRTATAQRLHVRLQRLLPGALVRLVEHLAERLQRAPPALHARQGLLLLAALGLIENRQPRAIAGEGIQAVRKLYIGPSGASAAT